MLQHWQAAKQSLLSPVETARAVQVPGHSLSQPVTVAAPNSSKQTTIADKPSPIEAVLYIAVAPVTRGYRQFNQTLKMQRLLPSSLLLQLLLLLHTTFTAQYIP
jgi:hypothetical protein